MSGTHPTGRGSHRARAQVQCWPLFGARPITSPEDCSPERSHHSRKSQSTGDREKCFHFPVGLLKPEQVPGSPAMCSPTLQGLSWFVHPTPASPPGHFFPLPQSILIMAELSPYPPPNSYVEVLIPVHLIVTVFGDRVFKEVIMLK